LEANYGSIFLVRGGITDYASAFQGRIQWSPPGG